MNRVATDVNREVARIPETGMVAPLSRQFRWLRFVLVSADTLALILAFALSYWLRFALLLSVSPEAPPAPLLYFKLSVVFVPLWITLFFLFGLYEKITLLGGTREYEKVAQACTFGMGLVVFSTFLLLPLTVVARGWVVYAWIVAILLVSALRFAIRRVAYRLRTHGYLLARALVISGGSSAASLVEDLSDPRGSGLSLLGFLSISDGLPESSGTGGCLGGLSRLPELLRMAHLDEVIVDMRTVSRESLLEIMEQAAEVPTVHVRVSTGLYEILTTGQEVRTVGPIPLTSCPRLRLDPRQRFLKGCLDYAGALIGVLLLAPLFLVLAALIKWTSPGPIFYRRKVLGRGGREFEALKFRTMCVSSSETLARSPELLSEWKRRGKISEDPRITVPGRLLRRYSLDELPQLLNVLAGQMSLVGPRIITREELSHYGRFASNLLTVKPGLTGLWQVSGRADLDYADRVRLDMHYIQNYSVWNDLQILFVRTIPAIIRAKGAY